jgi:hypothetical protein
VKACSPTAEAYRQRDGRSESVGGCRPETLVGPRVYAFFRRRGEHGLTAEFHDLLRVKSPGAGSRGREAEPSASGTATGRSALMGSRMVTPERVVGSIASLAALLRAAAG